MKKDVSLERFVNAQKQDFQIALSEIKNGRKRSHWMWYIFPQFDGLGFSSTSRRYSIKSVAEAEAYLNHAVLGPRLVECAEAVLGVEGVHFEGCDVDEHARADELVVQLMFS